jgi:ribosomal protein L11 methyltransferase
MLAPALLSRVAPGGHLVLSGILAFQAEDLIETFAKADPSVQLSVWMQEKDWVCLAGQKK